MSIQNKFDKSVDLDQNGLEYQKVIAGGGTINQNLADITDKSLSAEHMAINKS